MLGKACLKEGEHAGFQRIECLRLNFGSGAFMGDYEVKGMTMGMGS